MFFYTLLFDTYYKQNYGFIVVHSETANFVSDRLLSHNNLTDKRSCKNNLEYSLLNDAQLPRSAQMREKAYVLFHL